MSLIKEIKEQLKAKSVGVNLSNKRQDAIAAFIDAKISTVEEIEAALNTYAEYRPFADIAKEDDRERLAETKTAQEKEAARLKAIAEGKPEPVNEDPNETAQDRLLKQILEQNKALFGEIATIKGEKVTNTRRELYAKVLEGKDPVFVASELKKFDKMAFADDADFSNTLADFTQDITNSGLGGDRVQSGLSNMPNGKIKPATKDELDSVVSNLKI